MTVWEKVQANVGPAWKAVVGFVTPGLIALGVALQPTSDAGVHVTATELVGIVLACLGTSAVVYAVPNSEPGSAKADVADDGELN